MPRPFDVRRRIGRRSIAAFTFAILGWLAAAGVAFGHADLVDSTPADGATVPPPGEVVATFSEAIVGDGSALEVRDAAGATVATGGLDPNDPDHVTMRVALPVLAPGTYTVRWTTVAEDGDVERGTFSFTVAAAPSPSPSPTPLPSPVASAAPSTGASAAPSPTAVPSQRPAPAQDGGAGDATAVAIPIVAALVVVGLAAAWVRRRQRG